MTLKSYFISGMAVARDIKGRTDNQVKNFWNTHLIKKFSVNKKKKSKVCAPPKYIPMVELEQEGN